jgi:hypothetical protein
LNEWADDAARARCAKTVKLLMAAEQETFKTRRAQEPMCGWLNGPTRSVYTKKQWREAA